MTMSNVKGYNGNGKPNGNAADDGYWSKQFVFNPRRRYITDLMGTEYAFSNIEMEEIRILVKTARKKLRRSESSISASDRKSNKESNDLRISPLEYAALAFISTHAFDSLRIRRRDWDDERIRLYMRTLQDSELLEIRTKSLF